MTSGVRVSVRDSVARITLSRPEVKNAFDAQLIADLTEILRAQRSDESLRVLVIGADGPMFCAGADFNWMRAQKTAGFEANIADARALFDMFFELYTFPRPTIARVQGGAFGGGVGLIACCDFVVMAKNASVAFSEVKLGLAPATISPFVIRKLGEGRAREWLLTGAMMSAERALTVGLANRVVPENELDAAVADYVERVRTCGPHALSMTKDLLREIPGLTLAEAREFTTERIAQQRASDEGQEGMAAFLDKRKPSWMK